MRCDYLVWSADVNTVYGYHAAVLYESLVTAYETMRYGYRFRVGDDGLAVGRLNQDGVHRVMLQAAGEVAEPKWQALVAMRRLDVEAEVERVSMRRVDMQWTVGVDRASQVIDGLAVANGYSHLRINSLDSGGIAGSGIYVGAPTSEIRLRIYDKGAQLRSKLGVFPSGEPIPEAVRFELILRKRKATLLLELAAVSDHQAEDYVLHHIIRRVPAAETLIRTGRVLGPLPRLGDALKPDTDTWLYQAVIPAVARRYGRDPDGFYHWWQTLQERMEGYRSNAQSDEDGTELWN